MSRSAICVTWVLLIVALTAAMALAQESGCGTVVPPAQVEYELAQKAAGVDYSSAKMLPQAESIPLTIHIVRSSTGAGGLSTSDLNQAMLDLNAMYVPMDFTFYICGSVDYIDDDNFYLNMSTIDQINALRQVNAVYGTINVWFVPGISNFPYCGISSFTGSAVQGIVMSNSCTAGGNPSTFSHEIGHYFDLYHTHATSFGVECPDGSNCSVAGDLLCDTPADPGLSDDGGSHVSPYPDCQYDNFASTPDGCSGTYNPQTENLMSYSQKPCRFFWSDDQVAKVIFTLNNGRSELLTGCSPVIQYVGRVLAEVNGDGDDLLEASETFDIDVTIRNLGSEALGTAGTLSTTDTYVTVENASALFDASILSGGSSTTQTSFRLSVAPGCPDPHIALFAVDITADGGFTAAVQLHLHIGSTPGFADDVEAGAGYWSHYARSVGLADDWHIDTYRSHGGASSWKLGGLGSENYSDGSDAALVTPPFLLGQNASLTFWYWIDAEDDAGMTAWDGGIVMISDGGGIWTKIHPVEGYPYTIIDNAASPFAPETPCYSGLQDWVQATFDLSAHSGVAQIMYRFGSDGAVNREGWYVDDIAVTGGMVSCCVDRVGDANSEGGDEPTIGDASMMIDAKFLTGTCVGTLECLTEADVNQSGGSDPTCDDVTIGDISVLIDYLFLTGSSLGLPDCM